MSNRHLSCSILNNELIFPSRISSAHSLLTQPINGNSILPAAQAQSLGGPWLLYSCRTHIKSVRKSSWFCFQNRSQMWFFSSSLPLSLLPGSLQQLATDLPASTLLLQSILMSSQFIYWKYKWDQVTLLTQTRQCLSISFSANFKVLPMACENTLSFTFLTSSPTSLRVHSAPDTLPFLIFLEQSQIDSCLLILALLFHLPAVLFP